MTEISINENLKEITKNPEQKGMEGFEISPEQANQITAELSKLNDAILHDKPILIDDLEDLSKVAKGTKIDVGGIIMTVEEAESIPDDLKMNVEIWKEIRSGNFDNMYYLTYLSESMAIEFKQMGHFSHEFPRVKSLPDGVLEHLVGERYLSLGISTISDKDALCLDRQKGRLTLYKLTDLSDVAAEQISKIPDSLYLTGLETISDSAAELLGRHKGELILDGIINISDEAVKSLSENDGELRFCGLKSLSDQAAKYLGERDPKDRVCLQGLTTISDDAARSLAKNAGVIFNNFYSYGIQNQKVRDQITKFRK
jgi:hypothetical protein